MQISSKYEATGASVRIDSLGMRPMQRRVYEFHSDQYVLLKSPPASGKSRALMYVALEKLRLGQVSKVVVSVPERTIGASFRSQSLRDKGFHSDWVVADEYDLCSPESEEGKVDKLIQFLQEGSGPLVCTHSTLRSAFQKAGAESFSGSLVAIDEFHHVSSKEDSRLGEAVRAMIQSGSVHLFAMTGSYFRGDSEPILQIEDEAKFKKVTYSYYEQLDGYEHLKTIDIGMSFYRGTYLDSFSQVFDESKKTIIHIPSVTSGESTKEKHLEVASLLDTMGTYLKTNPDTGVLHVAGKNGRELRIIDLVNDNPEDRFKASRFLREMSKPEDLDVVIALGMAKEGFDWPFCEVAITVGYRASMTELVQIIGRTTRDAPNKSKASFINFVAEPIVTEGELVSGTNNIFKAIAASLLMEDVLSPKAGFLENRAKPIEIQLGALNVKGFVPPTSKKVAEIIAHDLVDLRAKIFQDDRYAKGALGGTTPEILNKYLTPKIIEETYPNLDADERRELCDAFVITNALRSSSVTEANGQKFVKIGNSLVEVEDLDLDLIYKINPFQETFEVVSKELSTDVLREIQDVIRSSRSELTAQLANDLWPKVNEWFERFGREPDYDSADPEERALAEVLALKRQERRLSKKLEDRP